MDGARCIGLVGLTASAPPANLVLFAFVRTVAMLFFSVGCSLGNPVREEVSFVVKCYAFDRCACCVILAKHNGHAQGAMEKRSGQPWDTRNSAVLVEFSTSTAEFSGSTADFHAVGAS